MVDMSPLRVCAGCGKKVYWAVGGFWCAHGGKYGSVCGEATDLRGSADMGWWPQGARHEVLDLQNPATVARWLET